MCSESLQRGLGTGFGPSGSHWGDPAPRILIAEVTSKEALPAAQPLQGLPQRNYIINLPLLSDASCDRMHPVRPCSRANPQLTPAAGRGACSGSPAEKCRLCTPEGHHPEDNKWRKGNRKVKGQGVLRRGGASGSLLCGYFIGNQTFALGL